MSGLTSPPHASQAQTPSSYTAACTAYMLAGRLQSMQCAAARGGDRRVAGGGGAGESVKRGQITAPEARGGADVVEQTRARQTAPQHAQGRGAAWSPSRAPPRHPILSPYLMKHAYSIANAVIERGHLQSKLPCAATTLSAGTPASCSSPSMF
jgi:hypothetical protein